MVDNDEIGLKWEPVHIIPGFAFNNTLNNKVYKCTLNGKYFGEINLFLESGPKFYNGWHARIYDGRFVHFGLVEGFRTLQDQKLTKILAEKWINDRAKEGFK